MSIRHPILVANKLLNSSNPANNSIDNLWIKEINKRREEIEKGDVSLVHGDEVFKKCPI